MLSTEIGVYVAEAVSAKNTKQAKGRYRLYEDQDGMVFLDFVVLSLYFFFLYVAVR